MTLFILHLKRKGDFVIGAVNTKDAVHLNLRGTFVGDFTIHGIRREYDFRIAGALHDVLMHPAVPRSAAAIAAGCVHHDRAARFAGAGIKLYNSALQLKGAVNGVQDIPESEVYSGSSWVEGDGLGVQGRGGT